MSDLVGSPEDRLSHIFVYFQCTASCGGGAQKRSAKCMDNRGNSVADSYCDIKELALERSCNNQPCANWKIEDWSGVSVHKRMAKSGDPVQTACLGAV